MLLGLRMFGHMLAGTSTESSRQSYLKSEIKVKLNVSDLECTWIFFSINEAFGGLRILT